MWRVTNSQGQASNNSWKGWHQRYTKEKYTFPEGVITQELETFEYQYTAHGVRYSAPSGFHDDAVMALALAWYKFNKSKGHGQYSFI